MSQQYLDYFYSRGLDEDIIKTFKLGWCNLKGKCSHHEFLPFVDNRFFNHVLFPIYNLHDDLISVSARSIDANNKNYIHTSYNKKDHLYGLNTTHFHILNSQKVYIVEGNFDLLTLYKNGIKNVVAMLGSNLSLSQVSLLVRFTNKLVLASDGDDAGFKCRRNFIEMAKKNNISFNILKLPNGYDPDSYVKKYGAQSFLKLEQKDALQRIKEIL